MKAGNQMVTASSLRWLMACGLAAAFGATACNGDLSANGMAPTGTAASTGNPGVTGAGNTVLPTGPGSGGTNGAGGAAAASDVGTLGVDRLNNLEYDNTVMDLTGVPGMAQATFQPDESGQFDNDADAFTVNDASYEQYFDAADTIGEAVFASPTLTARIVGMGGGCAPATTDTTCISKVIAGFGLKAWRRPLLATEVTRLVQLYSDAMTTTGTGATPNDGLKQIVKTLLASPNFLYRIEFDPNPASLTAHALSSYELATRLSYMTWSTMPDDALFALAANDGIQQSVNITAQVDRMLADPNRGEIFTQQFAGQWLGGRVMQAHQVEPTAYPSFDEPLRAAMITETNMYFDDFFKGTLPMTQFFTTQENFVNARLAQHYGFPAPAGTGFVKVTNGAASGRIGFMGLASFLTQTSFSYRTAPTLRGKWVLENLLCEMIPQPPVGVPALDTGAATDPALQSENVAVRLAAHRGMAASCSGCHSLLDPIGLGLENFDGIGAYRTKYPDGETINPAGVLPTGETFTSLSQLANILATGSYAQDGSYTQKLVNCASQTMMTYALARALTTSDQPYLSQIQQQWSTQGWGMKPLLHDIVLNDTFRFRHGEM
jgi:Protein of unknown function (DUF1592)/Protein of unknown function (DUF1588)/Protein of unknown function (DUF1595)/Protein of unknown function (DUF1587)/Protein of unknown function (DUF1585)